MRTCAGTLALGALCLVIIAAVVAVTLTPAGAQVVDAGLLTSLVLLVGPIVLVIGIAAVGVAKNEPKATGGRAGGCVAAAGVGVTALVVGGILLLCAKWTGG